MPPICVSKHLRVKSEVGPVVLDARVHHITYARVTRSSALADRGSGVTADAVGTGLSLLVSVGDLSEPRARVRVADLLRHGGRRPLNVRREAGQAVRLALEDPDGVWAAGVPALEVALVWAG